MWFHSYVLGKETNEQNELLDCKNRLVVSGRQTVKVWINQVKGVKYGDRKQSFDGNII